MSKLKKTPGRKALIILTAFLAGAGTGLAWALGLDEEKRRSILKAFFELKELPFRIFV